MQNVHTKEREKLLRAESLLGLVERTAYVGVWTLDIASGALAWSDELAAIHDAPAGFAPAQGDPFGFYAPEWRDKIVALVDLCATTGTPFDEEMQIVTVKGRRAWVRTVGQAVLDETGDVVRVEGAVQEIAPHGYKPGTLMRHTVSMGGAMGSGEAFATVDRQGRFTYLNEMAERLLNRPSRELLGRPIWNYFQKTVRLRLEEQFRRSFSTGMKLEAEELDAQLSSRSRCAAIRSAAAWPCTCATSPPATSRRNC